MGKPDIYISADIVGPNGKFIGTYVDGLITKFEKETSKRTFDVTLSVDESLKKAGQAIRLFQKRATQKTPTKDESYKFFKHYFKNIYGVDDVPTWYKSSGYRQLNPKYRRWLSSAKINAAVAQADSAKANLRSIYDSGDVMGMIASNKGALKTVATTFAKAETKSMVDEGIANWRFNNWQPNARYAAEYKHNVFEEANFAKGNIKLPSFVSKILGVIGGFGLGAAIKDFFGIITGSPRQRDAINNSDNENIVKGGKGKGGNSGGSQFFNPKQLAGNIAILIGKLLIKLLKRIFTMDVEAAERGAALINKIALKYIFMPEKIFFKKMLGYVKTAVKQSQVKSALEKLNLVPFIIMIEFLLLPVLKRLIPYLTDIIHFVSENIPTIMQMGEVLADIAESFMKVFTTSVINGDFFSNPIKYIIDGLIDGFKAVVEWFADNKDWVMNKIYDILMSAFKFIATSSDLMVQLATSIKELLMRVVNSDVFNEYVDLIKDAFIAIITKLNDILQDPKVQNAIYQFVSAFIQAFINSFLSVLSAMPVFGGLFKGIAKWMNYNTKYTWGNNQYYENASDLEKAIDWYGEDAYKEAVQEASAYVAKQEARENAKSQTNLFPYATSLGGGSMSINTTYNNNMTGLASTTFAASTTNTSKNGTSVKWTW